MTKNQITDSIQHKYLSPTQLTASETNDQSDLRKTIQNLIKEQDFPLFVKYFDILHPGFQNKFNEMITLFIRTFMGGALLSCSFSDPEDYSPPFLRPRTHDFLFLFREIESLLEKENINKELLIDIEILRKVKEWKTLEVRECYDYEQKKFVLTKNETMHMVF